MACTMGSYFHVAMGLTPRTRISSSCGNNKISTSNSNLRWSSAARQGSCFLLRATGSVAEDMTTRKLSLSSSSSTLPFRTSPWLMLPPNDPKVNTFYSFEEKKTIRIQKHPTMEHVGWPQCMCLGSSHGWLVYINRSDCALFLFNPISHRIINLPSIDTLPSVKPPGPSYSMIQKLIISSSPDDDDDEEANPCIAMCIYGLCSRVAFCWPGHDTTWIPLDEGICGIMQIVYSCKDQLFYSFDYCHILESFDLRDASSPKRRLIEQLAKEEEEEEHHLTPFPGVECLEEEWTEYHYSIRPYLIPDPWSEDFLMVERFVVYDIPQCGKFYFMHEYPYETRFFKVYKVDLSSGTMKYQQSLDDRVLFVGINQPFSLPASDFPHLRRNSIYFTNEEMNVATVRGHIMGSFNYEDKVLEPCNEGFFNYHRRDVKKTTRYMPHPFAWFTPNSAPPGCNQEPLRT